MPGMPWRVSEVRVLTDAIRRAMAPAEIALPGRSPIAVRRMAARLRLIGDGVPRKRWTDAQRARLADLVAAGHTATRIAAAGLLPHNRNAVQKQMQRMGLGSADRSAPQKAATRLQGPALDRFHAFLRARAGATTPAQLARRWNDLAAAEGLARVSQRKVVYHMGQIGLRGGRTVVVPTVVTQSIKPVPVAPRPMPVILPSNFAPSVAYARGA